MQTLSFAGLLLLLIALLLAGVIIIVVYFAVYNKKINRTVTQNTPSKHRMIPPPIFAVIIALCVAPVFIMCIFIAIFGARLGTGAQEEYAAEYYDADYDFMFYTSAEMTGYLSGYSIEQNDGYTKHTETKGNVRFTYFISEAKYDVFHPSFLIFAEYLGGEEIVSASCNGSFFPPADEETYEKGGCISGFGASVNYSDAKDDYIMVLGNKSIDCVFELELAFYYELVKSENIGDNAAAFETLSFYS